MKCREYLYHWKVYADYRQTDEGPSGHPSGVKSAQTVKIRPALALTGSGSARYAALIRLRVESRARSWSIAIIVLPRSANAMVLRP
jgi:hypothetical protein